MMYLMIENVGEVDFDNIRILGHSTKDGINSIGMFGTGAKYSIALLVRLGASPVIFSGKDRIDIEDTGKELVYVKKKYGAGTTRIPSSISKNLGQHDWVDPWFAFRDLICNAIDAGNEFASNNQRISEYGKDYLWETMAECWGERGKTRVFVPLNDATLQGFSGIRDKFCFDRDGNNYKTDRGPVKLMPKKFGRIYKKGVYVKDIAGLTFDYDMKELKLNESRTADDYNINNIIMDTIEQMNKDDALVLWSNWNTNHTNHTNQDSNGTNVIRCHERSVCMYPDNKVNNDLGKAFNELFPNSVLCIRGVGHVIMKLQELGYGIVEVENYGQLRYFGKCGIKTASDVLKNVELDFETMNINEDCKAFQKIRDIYERWFVNKGSMPTFKLMIVSNDSRRGLYKNNICYVNKQFWSDDGMSLDCQITVFEEMTHHFAKCMDGRPLIDEIIKIILEDGLKV